MSHRRIRSPGKSNFLKFMLAWLLSAQQVVLLCNNDLTYLFYSGGVYSRPTAPAFMYLPVHQGEPDRSVWVVIDVDSSDHGPPVTGDLTVWPIQASSPKSIRWRIWRKQLPRTALWGMPLWNRKELLEGYAFSTFYLSSRGSSLTLLHRCSLSLSPYYKKLRSMFEGHLSQLDGPTAPKTGGSQVDALLEVLHLERKRKREAVAIAAAEEKEAATEQHSLERKRRREAAVKEAEAAEEKEPATEQHSGELGDHMAMDQDVDMVNQDVDMANQVDQAKQPQVPVHEMEMEQALKILVRIATEEFGFIPRDVYSGLLDLPEMRKQHTDALANFNYSDLKLLIRAFTDNKDLDISSHRVIVVFPTENWTTSDLWGIDFKSIRVAENAVEVMRQREDQNSREIYDSIQGLPNGSILAGRVFEEIAHRL